MRATAEALAARLPPLQVAAERVASTVAQGVHGRRRIGTGDSFWQFRPYVSGDAGARIDWKQSAKSDRTYVRDMEWEAAQTVCLWRDAGLTRPWNDPFADAELALSAEASTVILAFDGWTLAGSVMTGFDGHRGWVYYLAVAEARRRRGVGRALMRAAEQWLQARGAPKLQLMVRADNLAAEGFYEAIGYGREAVSVLSRRL